MQTEWVSFVCLMDTCQFFTRCFKILLDCKLPDRTGLTNFLLFAKKWLPCYRTVSYGAWLAFSFQYWPHFDRRSFDANLDIFTPFRDWAIFVCRSKEKQVRRELTRYHLSGYLYIAPFGSVVDCASAFPNPNQPIISFAFSKTFWESSMQAYNYHR